ncbi:hypothetical protein FDP41_009684 [Naegleria fowleri]|uniref:Endonuclease/exonuclease/phosphatase domain-containing protein n=1 Tax=Naegleria fowleri TaxID=5763 RepID=A0A6A5BDI6_NAEFO|nr:uncharacterized protein FDP41_009684 [Naegleria fowleri]KAF0971988.1 hypothetical protein FDP41_009684 [Naegleria fowleri]CAG4711308.1 unnamed protein product [Naegleria fowleri]
MRRPNSSEEEISKSSEFACLSDLSEHEVAQMLMNQQNQTKRRGRPKKKPTSLELFPIENCMGRNWKCVQRIGNVHHHDEDHNIISSIDSINTENSLSFHDPSTEHQDHSNNNTQPYDNHSQHFFRLLSYNMLCQDYSRKQYCPHLPDTSEILYWANRKIRLWAEFMCYDADIICLQECDKYSTHWKDKFLKAGYASSYTQRTAFKPDGCATFWKLEKFEVLDEFPIFLNEVGQEIQRNSEIDVNERSDLNGNVVTSSNLISKFITNNIANIVLLRHFDTYQVFCVVNLHLFWDPSYPEVKLCQAQYVLMKTFYFLHQNHDDIDSTITILLCGDFNSMPDSEVYELLTKGEAFIPGSFIPFTPNGEFSKYVSICETSESSQEASSSEGASPLRFRQKLTNPLSSSGGLSLYKKVIGQEPPFTNYTKNYKGCLDYAFQFNHVMNKDGPPIKTTCVSVCRALEMISQERASEYEALPSDMFPSDHIALCFDFSLLHTNHQQ